MTGDTQRVDELARRLGETLARHPRCVALREASAAFQADPAAQELRERYDAVVTRLQAKLARGEALEPEEKREEEELRREVAAHAGISALVRAQADFHELMGRVNASIQRALDL